MKLKLRFLIATLFVLAIYIPAVQAQANLTFSGGNGTSFSMTLQQSVSYIITSDCGFAPFFIFDETGTPFSLFIPTATSTITYTINGGNTMPVENIRSGVTRSNITGNDLFIYPTTQPFISMGSIIILNAGNITTNGGAPLAPPANGNYTTFITNGNGIRCSSDGVAIPVTSASVSVSGRVLTSNKHGLANAFVYLTDSEGSTRTARTNSFGYYRFDDIQVGQTVTLTVMSKRYQFAPQVLNLNEEKSGVNFLAEQ